MRKRVLAFVLMFVGLVALAQQKENVAVDDFDKITMRIGGTVYVTQGNTNEVVVEGDREDMEEVNIEVRGRELVIESRRRSSWRFWENTNTQLDVYVRVKELTAVTVSGSGDIVSQNTIETDDFRARVSGSGDIELALDARTFNTGISGSGNIELSGSARSGSLSISGSGKLLAENMKVDDFEVSISGSGRGSIMVYGELDVRISGSGSVYYSGEPTAINTKISGSGKVRRIN